MIEASPFFTARDAHLFSIARTREGMSVGENGAAADEI